MTRHFKTTRSKRNRTVLYPRRSLRQTFAWSRSWCDRRASFSTDVESFRLKTVTPVILIRQTKVYDLHHEPACCEPSFKVVTIKSPVTRLSQISETILVGCRPRTHRD